MTFSDEDFEKISPAILRQVELHVEVKGLNLNTRIETDLIEAALDYFHHAAQNN